MLDFVSALLVWFVRVVYFTGRLLTAADLGQEQDYDRDP